MDRRKVANELDTIIRLVERVQSSIASHDRESFEQDHDAADANTYRLAMIAEHCNHLPDDLKARHPNIPWKEMVGLRNIVSHAYDAIDTGIVWSAATMRIEEIGAMCHAEQLRLENER